MLLLAGRVDALGAGHFLRRAQLAQDIPGGLLERAQRHEVPDVDGEGNESNDVEEGLHQVVEDALAGVDAEAEVSDDEDGDGSAAKTDETI